MLAGQGAVLAVQARVRVVLLVLVVLVVLVDH
jgi:hypothetical protein